MAVIAGEVPSDAKKTPDQRPRPRFRPDIDGLRAVAVLLVVLFHADVPWFGGGFVGVDVFFVLSGFLITTGLVMEADQSGRVDIVRFWLRRARRLLPAAGAMIGVVTTAQLAYRSPLVWDTVLNESLAAATYWSNEQAARISGGYFGAQVESRALLHTWSLSVEEQFYIVWPLLFAGLIKSRLRLRMRSAVVVSFIIMSLAYSAQLLSAGDPGAYFAAASRAWEFLAGSLLALFWPAVRWAKPVLERFAGFLTAAGIGLIVFAAAWLGPDRDFPWPFALLPVSGTLVVLMAEAGRTHPLGRLLASKPLQLLGRLSYSWYLWHWPVLVLGKDLSGSRDHLASVVLAFGALVPAYASYRYIEAPLRVRSRSTRAGETFSAFIIPVGITLLTLASGLAYRAWVFTDPLVTQAEIASNGWPEHLGGCYRLDVVDFEERCVFGTPSGTKTIMVIGDSHAAHWIPAFDEIGGTNDARVVALQVGNCPLLSAKPPSPTTISTPLRPQEPVACTELRRDLPTAIAQVGPDLVVASASESYVERTPSEISLWENGHRDLATRLASDGIGLLLLHDVARWETDPLECLIEGGRCALERDKVEAHRAPVANAERDALISAGHGILIDPLDLLCGPEWCEPRDSSGEIIMQDSHHITRAYARSLAPHLEPLVTDALNTKRP